MAPHNVVVFLPLTAVGYLAWLALCANYCLAKRYQVVTVVHEWSDVLKLLAEGRAEIAVTPQRDMIPHDPRVEVIEEEPDPQVEPRRRRPRLRLRG